MAQFSALAGGGAQLLYLVSLTASCTAVGVALHDSRHFRMPLKARALHGSWSVLPKQAAAGHGRAQVVGPLRA